MTLKLLTAALLLAHRSAMAISIGDYRLAAVVTATVTDTAPAITAFVTSTASAGPGEEACATAWDVIDYCAEDVPDFNDKSEEEQAACLCCYDTVYLEPAYVTCGSYIQSNYPQSSEIYSVNSAVASFCSGQSAVCAASAAATQTASGSYANVPAACSSVINMVESCEAGYEDIATVDNAQMAACLCYTGASSTFTTAFDNYAKTCAAFVKTADPGVYYNYEELEGFCASNAGSGGSGGATASSGGSVAFPLPTTSGDSASATGTTTSATKKTTAASQTAAATTTTSNPASPAVLPGGALVWAAGLVSFLLSFFAMA